MGHQGTIAFQIAFVSKRRGLYHIKDATPSEYFLQRTDINSKFALEIIKWPWLLFIFWIAILFSYEELAIHERGLLQYLTVDYICLNTYQDQRRRTHGPSDAKFICSPM